MPGCDTASATPFFRSPGAIGKPKSPCAPRVVADCVLRSAVLVAAAVLRGGGSPPVASASSTRAPAAQALRRLTRRAARELPRGCRSNLVDPPVARGCGRAEGEAAAFAVSALSRSVSLTHTSCVALVCAPS